MDTWCSTRMSSGGGGEGRGGYSGVRYGGARGGEVGGTGGFQSNAVLDPRRPTIYVGTNIVVNNICWYQYFVGTNS